MIKNIVFDCSDTLLRFSAQDELAKVTGDNERAAEIKGKIHQSRSWNLYDKGIISEEELRQGILPFLMKPIAPMPPGIWITG